MPIININTNESDGEATSYVLAPADGRFIVLSVTRHLSIYLRGYEADSIAHAKEIIAALTKSVAEMDTPVPEGGAR